MNESTKLRNLFLFLVFKSISLQIILDVQTCLPSVFEVGRSHETSEPPAQFGYIPEASAQTATIRCNEGPLRRPDHSLAVSTPGRNSEFVEGAHGDNSPTLRKQHHGIVNVQQLMQEDGTPGITSNQGTALTPRPTCETPGSVYIWDEI